MTTYQTSLDVAPAGTAIPLTGVAGSGDAFTSGNDNTTTFVSANDEPAALADGSYAGKITVPATTATTIRSWALSNWSTLHYRFYVFLPGTNNAVVAFALLQSAVGVIGRMQIDTSRHLVLTGTSTSGTTAIATSTGTLPLSTLVRIEASWDLVAGTCSADAYLGHDTSPIANTSLSLTGRTFRDTSADLAQFGQLGAVSSYTFYTDAWGVSDTARLGPVAVFGTPTGLTATVVSSSAIDVTWDAMPPATGGFDVERDGAIVATVPAGTYVFHDTGLNASTLYSYRVRAVG